MIDIYVLFLLFIFLAFFAGWWENRVTRWKRSDDQIKAEYQARIIKRGNGENNDEKE